MNITHFRGKDHMSNILLQSFLMKDDVKIMVLNETPRILIPLDGVVNYDGVLKSDGKPKGDHVMHL
jgi:hypothetical protein